MQGEKLKDYIVLDYIDEGSFGKVHKGIDTRK